MFWSTSKLIIVLLVLLSEMKGGLKSTDALSGRACPTKFQMLLAREREKPFGHGATLLRLRGGIVQESIPQSLAAAVKRGEVAGEVVGRYAAALAKLPHNFRWILRFEIIWRRMLADEDLFLKMSTEALMGCSMQAVAEIQQRGGAFLQQLDLVSADLFIVMIQCLACVVYAAPVVQTHDEDRGALGRFLSGCPSSVFGKRPNQDAPPFSALQRLFAYLKPMPALFIIGSGASVCGYVYSSLLLQLRFFLSTLKKMVRSRIRFSGQKGKTSYSAISPSSTPRLRRLQADSHERSTTPSHEKNRNPSISPPKPLRTSSQSFHDFRRVASSSPKPHFLSSPTAHLPSSEVTTHDNLHDANEQHSFNSDASSMAGELTRGRKLSSPVNPRRARGRSVAWSPKFLLSERGMKRSRTILVSALSRSGLHSHASVIFRSPTLMRHDARRFARSPTLVIQSPSMMKPSPSLFLLQPDASEDESGYTPLSVVLKVAGFVGLYVAIFSNFRGQFMEGVLEQRVLANIFKGSGTRWHSVLSFILRMVNYYVGSAAFVFFYNLFCIETEDTDMFFPQDLEAA